MLPPSNQIDWHRSTRKTARMIHYKQATEKIPWLEGGFGDLPFSSHGWPPHSVFNIQSETLRLNLSGCSVNYHNDVESMFELSCLTLD